jgi:hypothetical protein
VLLVTLPCVQIPSLASVSAASYLAVCSEQFPDLLTTSISAASYLAVCSEQFPGLLVPVSLLSIGFQL